MATYALYTFPEHNSGDTFPGVDFTVTVNDIALALEGAIIKMYISDKIYSTITGELQITDAAGGKFRFKEQIIILPSLTHSYKIEILFSSGKKRTYIKGTWTIT